MSNPVLTVIESGRVAIIIAQILEDKEPDINNWSSDRLLATSLLLELFLLILLSHSQPTYYRSRGKAIAKFIHLPTS